MVSNLRVNLLKGAMLACCAALVLVNSGPLAKSEPMLPETAAIIKAVERYGRQIQASYDPEQERMLPTDVQGRLARKNGVETDVSSRIGFTRAGVDVSTKVISIARDGLANTVVADITTNIHLVPLPGAEIHIAGENRDRLNSSYTEQHVLTMERESTHTDTFTVTKDRLKEYVITP
ncbi:hypothetical protein KIMH_10120 [Bombiscardovia apis]|uniref:Uncharacterized protein n=1 Tax=Bombiscardovia apis TaxID=2932182 RepID=A0ABN6SHU6_9BIFI|nr:hypothetical protein [Bombiscardovia apis]BDR54901.1 hypothetical protein KIMH_10120 [Bombiscardovia apis]